MRATTISGPPGTLPESLRDDWQRLTAPTTAATLFTQDLLDGLPEPARRWLTHAIAPGTPLRRAAVLRQHGEIKVGRWLRYEADWALAPPEGFIWAATSHFGPLFIRGFDRYTRGTAALLDGSEEIFDGFTVPTRCRAGWSHCPDHCADEEFIRFIVDHANYQ